MEQERKDRFLEKINRIHDNSDLIILWEKEASDSLNIVDIKTALAIFKAFQEITEAFMDCIVFYIRENNLHPRDNYLNIEQIDIFSPDQKLLLKEMNEIWCRVNHEYGNSEVVPLITSISHTLSDIPQVTRTLQFWIENN